MTSATEEKDGETGGEHQDRCRRAQPRGSSHHAQRSHQGRERPPLVCSQDPHSWQIRALKEDLLLDKKQEPTEKDHLMNWIDIDKVGTLLFHEHHIWAVNAGLKVHLT